MNGKYIFHCCASANTYHKPKKGGNKALVNLCEASGYNNITLTKNTLTIKIQKKMEKKSNLQMKLEKEVRKDMYNAFCNELVQYLTQTNTNKTAGKITYAALIAAWRKDTVNCAYMLNENLGRKLLKENINDARVKKIGVEGHYSYFVHLANGQESDSISVIVAQWSKSWLSWYNSVVQFGHYSCDENELNSCAFKFLERAKDLWSYRGKGGRCALSDAEKKTRKLEKANANATAADILASLSAEQLAQIKSLLHA